MVFKNRLQNYIKKRYKNKELVIFALKEHK